MVAQDGCQGVNGMRNFLLPSCSAEANHTTGFTPGKAVTRSRNLAPRISKLRYWSNEAQAGDSRRARRLTPPGPPAQRARGAWNSRSLAISARVLASARWACSCDALRCVGLAQQHAHLRALEEHHRVTGMGGRHAIECRARVLELARGEVEHTEFQIVPERHGVRRTGALERVDGRGGLPHRHGNSPRWTDSAGVGRAQRVDLLPQRRGPHRSSLPLADAPPAPRPPAGARASRRRSSRHRHRALPVLAPRRGATRGRRERRRGGRDFGRPLEGRERLRVLAEGGVGGGQTQDRIEVDRILAEDRVQQRDHLARTSPATKSPDAWSITSKRPAMSAGRGASFRDDGRRRSD